MPDYMSPYYDPYADYNQMYSGLDAQIAAQQGTQPQGVGSAIGQLGGMGAGAYTSGQIPGVLSSLGGGAGTVGTGVTGAPVAGGLGALGIAPILGIAGGLALGAKGASDLIGGKETKGLGGWGGRATLGIATGGLSELVRPFLQHKTTRQIAKDHTKQLAGMGTDNKAWQSYVSGMREQFNSAPPDPSKPFHGGQYGSWDEYKKAGLDAKDLTGVYGNMKTFGPDWAGLSQDQREKVTQGVIDAGLYNSRKGEVEISDAAKAKSILDEILNKNKKISELDNVKKI